MQAGHSYNRSLVVIRYCLYPGSTLLSGMIWNNLPNFSMTPFSHKAQADNNSAYFVGLCKCQGIIYAKHKTVQDC